jgi:hypothetical protein
VKQSTRRIVRARRMPAVLSPGYSLELKQRLERHVEECNAHFVAVPSPHLTSADVGLSHVHSMRIISPPLTLIGVVYSCV